jgi:hypothetical protein
MSFTNIFYTFIKLNENVVLHYYEIIMSKTGYEISCVGCGD